jgi:uncharacterized protein (TIGR02646 family)
VLRQYRTADPAPSWDAFRDKVVVLSSLVDAQRGLCCYCTGKIDDRSAHVEHYLPQHGFEGRALDWDNLLAVCSGGRGRHCDASKADSVLHQLNPSDHPERHLEFRSDGTLGGRSEQADSDIACLGLNDDAMIHRRQAVMDAVLEHLRRRKNPTQTWTRIQLERTLADLLRSDAPYVQWAIRMVERRLARS